VIVSVVIPFFEQARELPRALRSVLGQTTPPGEVIVVDDGSIDGDAAQFAGLRVTVCRRPHAGAAAARNHGVDRAAGDWVAFLDADDEWGPQFLEKTCAVAEGRPELVAVFTNVSVDGANRPLLRKVSITTGAVDDYFQTLLENAGLGMSSSSVLVRRDALTAAGGFPDGVLVGEDPDTWARLAWTGPVGYVPECLATYHRDAAFRATTRRRLDAPEPPAFLRTHRVWSDAGRVPERLRRSSRRFANRVLADHAVELTHAGRAQEAEALLLDHWLPGGPAAFYWKARLWAHFPTVLLRWLRTARAALSSRWGRV
jgi:glycosyltransferase involved in cell wall biosynthesis